MDMVDLRGIGHFTFGFLLGTVVFFLVRATCHNKAREWALYGPFLPFALGLYGALPYLLYRAGMVSDVTVNAPIMNIFLGYAGLNQIPAFKALGNFELCTIILGLSYSALCIHYIRFIKQLRRKTHAQ